MEYKVEVNLNGPDGNAFALMRKAKYLGVKLDLSKDEIDSIVKEMMSGDYDNLVEVFKKFSQFSLCLSFIILRTIKEFNASA